MPDATTVWVFVGGAISLASNLAQIGQLYFQIRPTSKPRGTPMTIGEGVYVSRRRVAVTAGLTLFGFVLTAFGFYRSVAETEPDALVGVVNVVPLKSPLIAERTPVSLNIFAQGKKLAHDVRARELVSLRPEDSTREGEETWNDLQAIPYDPPSDLPPGQFKWGTRATRVITQSEATDLVDGRLFVYVVAQITYADRTGSHETQFCQVLQPPGDKLIWHPCPAHNTMH